MMLTKEAAMAKPLTLINPDHESTPEEIYMAKIDQSHREYRGELNAPWKPFAENVKRGLMVDDVLARSMLRVATVDKKISWWRRLVGKK